MNTRSYPLVVIGAGSGGLTAARTAAQFGVRVALIEKDKIGGDCLHTGCVPSKSLISVARKIHETKKLSEFMPVQLGPLDFASVHEYVHSRINHIETDTDNAEALEKEGVDVFKGEFHFNSVHSVKSDNTQIEFKKCIIATGSQPIVPAIEGLNDISYVTSDTIWELKQLPSSMAIIGGGPIGLELGQAFAMLGTQVSVFERGESLVPRLGSRVFTALDASLQMDGVSIIYESNVTGFQTTAAGTVVQYAVGEQKGELPVSDVLVAIGRTPDTKKLDLEAAGVAANERGGIIVDSSMRTKAKHIFAIGDCVGGPQFTHWAAEQGARAAIRALFGAGKGPDPSVLPSATFTTPEISQVGATEQQLIDKRVAYTKLELSYDQIDKAIAEQELGAVEVYIDKSHSVLGATVIGANAAELIGYFVILMNRKLPLDYLSGGVHAYPTYTINLKKLAADTQIAKASSSKVLQFYLKIRGMKS